jgi:putative selenate reductase
VKRVAVAGGGNTAMDAVRAALRIPGIEKVSLVYRRTRDEMPADREEIREALGEGAALEELALPEAARPGVLTVRRMRLGERDSSGRRSPLPSDATFDLGCDLLVEALGEAVDAALLASFGVGLGPDGKPLLVKATREAASAPGVYVGGDARRGPASIIAACHDGKKAAFAILRSGGVEPADRPYLPPAPDPAALASRGLILFPLEDEGPEAAFREANRCLECDSACLRCVEVCPNRANMAIPASGSAPYSQAFQILHVDALCNECGNCGFFCPYTGEPFRGKPTFFANKADLEASRNAGFAILPGPAPRLALRARPDEAVSVISYEEWELSEVPAGRVSRETASMAALAATVLRDHPYLLGGKA